MKYLLYLFSILAFTACQNNELIDPQDQIEKVDGHPNILLIIADDMGLDATPGYSEGVIKPSMPHLDQLASQGIIFENVWSYPLCSPTRASMLTGKYGYRTGVLSVENNYISSSETSIQRYLDLNTESAYAHAHIGKWHLSKYNQTTVPNDMGIGYYAGLMQGGLTDYYNWNLNINGTAEICEEYNTTKLTNLSIDWIKAQDKPWFCWLAYSSPHTPFHYPPAEMHNKSGDTDDNLSMYMAMLESIDFEIGRILDALDQQTIDNTLIIFVGDNGTTKEVLQSPYRGRKGKGSLYQGGINVPLIVSGKGVTRKNARDENLINTTDLFATIAEVAGAGIISYQESYSFKNLLSSEIKGLREFNFSEIDHGDNYRYTISDGEYKLITNNDSDDELYNLLDDPYESNDLFNSSNSSDAEAIQKLRLQAATIHNN